MFNWATAPSYCEAGGTNAATIKAVLGFDFWYGTQTGNDRTIGVFRPSSHQWLLDNGNNRLDTCGSNPNSQDTCLGTFGSTGERPVIGNWTGPGQYQSGVFRIGVFSPAINGWILDTTGNGTYDDCNVGTVRDWCPSLSISQPTDLPVVGDWTGNGKIRLGQFRPSTAQWFLDKNGNGVWNGCTTDRCATFGQSGDKPVVGDWSGTGTTKIGVFRNGVWILDYNGSFVQDTGDATVYFGVAGDTPCPFSH
jgi:hypothetical protein